MKEVKAISVFCCRPKVYRRPSPKSRVPPEINDFLLPSPSERYTKARLDLLLDLIRKQDIDIYDIPIARITAQYLTYVERMREPDVNVAADFIYMAAVPIHIKSKNALAPRPACARRRARRSAQRTGQPPRWSTRNLRPPPRCFCRSSRLKTRSGRIRR